MKRYLGVHINPSGLRAAVMAGDKPVLVPAKDGGLLYSTQELFVLSNGSWVSDERKLTELFVQVRADVERFAGSGQWEMVLTIPVAFGYGIEHRYLRPAAQRAGLPVAYVMKENAAVMMNYAWNGMGRGEEAFRVAVGMISPQTIGVSVFETSEDMVEELAVSGRRGAVSTQQLQRRMQETIEETVLGENPTADYGVKALMLNHEATSQPEYREVLKRLKKSGQKIYGYPDETAALGAALQAARLSGDRRVQEPLMLMALSQDYYVLLAEGRRVKMLSRGMTIPTRKSTVFTTAKKDQTSVLVCVAEVEDDYSEQETVIELPQKISAYPATVAPQIEVTMDVAASGHLACTSRVLSERECAEGMQLDALPPAKSTVEITSDQKQKKTGPEDKAVENTSAVAGREEMVSLSEFENFRRRMTQEKDAMYDQGICKALQKILPVVDSFERGLAMLSPEQQENDAAVGMKRIYRQMQKAMEELGVTPIQAVGQPFDLHRHNAVMQEEIPGVAENTVIEELEKGYLYHDTVLRYSIVKVSK